MRRTIKTIGLLLLCGITQIAFGQEPYSIKVKIKGLKQGDTVLIANYFGEKILRADTAIVNKEGVANFTGEKKLYRGMYLAATPDFKTFDFVVNDDQDFTLETDSAKGEFQKNMKVTGSEENKVFFDYLNFIARKSEEREALVKDYEAEQDSVKKTKINDKLSKLNTEVYDYQAKLFDNDSYVFAKILEAQKEPVIPEGMPDSLQYMFYKNNFWKTFDFSEEGLVRAPNALIKKKIDKYFDRLVFPNPDSIKKEVDYVISMASADREVEKYTIWYLGNRYQQSKVMCMDDVYIHIVKKYYCTGRAWWTDSAMREKMCEEATKASYTPCNGTAPNMKNLDTADVPIELYKVAGKYTIVFFWDPTCGHCKKVIPILDSIYDANKGKGWVIYAIGSENKYTEWREYIRTHPEIHDWVNVCKTDRYAPWPYRKQEYNNISNPTIYILDQDKKIRAKKISEHKVAEFMKYLEDQEKLNESN